MTTTTTPRLSPARMTLGKNSLGSETERNGKVSDLVGTPSIESFVDDLVDAIRTLAAALIGRASHPDNTDTEGDGES